MVGVVDVTPIILGSSFATSCSMEDKEDPRANASMILTECPSFSSVEAK
jgi:hypothetical protein